MNINPQNYEQVMHFQRCMRLKTLLGKVDDSLIEEVYAFLGEDSANMISISNGMLGFYDGNGKVSQVELDVAATDLTLTMSAKVMSMATYSSNSSYDGGSSGNNNNNNNNNNNG